MKCFFYIILFSMFISFIPSDQSMKETIDFVQSKLTGRHYIYDPAFKSISWDYEITYSFDGKTNILTQKKYGTFLGNPDTCISKIPLKYLNPENLKINNAEEDGSIIKIVTTNNKKMISVYESHRSSDGGFAKEQIKADFAYLYIPKSTLETNENIADRIMKAMKHAIILAGGKSESF